MTKPIPLQHEVALSLALAVIASSAAPLLLLDEDLKVIAASKSFCSSFHVDPARIVGRPIFELGAGEWGGPKLRSLLSATVSANAAIDAYEMDLDSAHGSRRLVLNAHKLSYDGADDVRILLSISDVTDARIAEKLKDDLLREQGVLLQEIQHRVANSLQIIASVLMQSARNVQSEEARSHLSNAHHRVMSIAQLQRQLAVSKVGDVKLRAYLSDLCRSIGASMIRDPKQLTLEVTVDDSAASADVSVSLGLIVTELVINSLKHAFPNMRVGKIAVGYKSDGADWILSVADDGIGMPVDAKDAKPGLGTSIINALANQLEAVVKVSDARPGTQVDIAHETASRVAAPVSA
jgi:two-component sensor histidine kinase